MNYNFYSALDKNFDTLAIADAQQPGCISILGQLPNGKRKQPLSGRLRLPFG